MSGTQGLTSIAIAALRALSRSESGVSSDLHRQPKMRDALHLRGMVAPHEVRPDGSVASWAITDAGRAWGEAETYPEPDEYGVFVVLGEISYHGDDIIAATAEFHVAMAFAVAARGKCWDGIRVVRYVVSPRTSPVYRWQHATGDRFILGEIKP